MVVKPGALRKAILITVLLAKNPMERGSLFQSNLWEKYPRELFKGKPILAHSQTGTSQKKFEKK